MKQNKVSPTHRTILHHVIGILKNVDNKNVTIKII